MTKFLRSAVRIIFLSYETNEDQDSYLNSLVVSAHSSGLAVYDRGRSRCRGHGQIESDHKMPIMI